MEIRQGQIIALFAFDIGFEVSMDKLKGLLSSVPVPPLTQKKQTPSHLQYSRPPRLVSLETQTTSEPSPAASTPPFLTLEPPALPIDGD